MDAPGTYRDLIRDHYRQEAQERGSSPSSTMPDAVGRERELDAIQRYLAFLLNAPHPPVALLEVGCGNGIGLHTIRGGFPRLQLTGVDACPEMVQLASSRSIRNCRVLQGDVTDLQFDDGSFDIVISERCLVNILDQDHQARALSEIWRVLAREGHFLMIEAFTDGLENMNRARIEFGLPPIKAPAHNLWLDKSRFLHAVQSTFQILGPQELGDRTLPDFNFLSSHYFMSRVVHAHLTRGDQLRNSEFVKFFSFLPPIGNYAAVQLFLLKKRASPRSSRGSAG